MLTIQSSGRVLSKVELESKARELGMVYKEEILIFPGQKSESTEVEAGQPNSGTQDSGEAGAPEKISIEIPTQEEAASGEAQIKVIIPNGSSSEKIAAILKNAGVIRDEKEFSKLLYTRKLASKLKAGEFYFPKGSTLDEVLKLLTIN